MTRMEEHFSNLLHFISNKEDATEAFKDVADAQAMYMMELKGQIDLQEATITALKDWVGELELGRHLLRNRIITIEVRMSMVASDLWN